VFLGYFRQEIKIYMNQKIGLLLPRSDMFPTLGMDLMNGLKLAIANSGKTDISPNFIVEGIGNAVDASLLKTAEKFILQEDVAITIAFCGNNQLTELIGIFSNYKKPLIHLDLGGIVLKKEHTSPFVLHHTLNSWQSAYAMGMYAAKELGKKAAMIASIYDGAYHMSAALLEGFGKDGGTVTNYYVSPMDYKTESFEGMVTGIRESSPDVIFALFSYKEGQKVFDVLANSDLNGTIPILAIPYMTDESVNTEDLKIENVKSVATWSFDDEHAEMHDFVGKYLAAYEEAPNIMGLLGFEAGLTLSNCISSEAKIASKLADTLQNKTIMTPRGNLQYNDFNESQIDSFKVREFKYNNTKYHNTVVDTLDTSFSETLYASFENLPNPGWQNPYICT